MQVAFQNENSVEKGVSSGSPVEQTYGVSTSGLNFRSGQTNFKSHKTQNENYGNKRVFSPYLSPSSVKVMDLNETQDLIDPIYMHNIARTKYFNISNPAKPADHLKLNLFA
jgi:hypothetical protein